MPLQFNGSGTTPCRAASSTFRSRWKPTSPAIRRWRCRRSSTCGTTRPSSASRRSSPACRRATCRTAPAGRWKRPRSPRTTARISTRRITSIRRWITRSARRSAAATIDEIPLEWCFQPGVKLDFRHFPDGYVATAEDVETELKRIGHALEAAGDRRRQHQRRREIRQARLRRFRLRHGPRGDALSHRARRPRHRHRRLELGRAVQLHGEALRARTATRRSSGKATRPAATSATATWKSCTTSKRCRRSASRSRAFR